MSTSCVNKTMGNTKTRDVEKTHCSSAKLKPILGQDTVTTKALSRCNVRTKRGVPPTPPDFVTTRGYWMTLQEDAKRPRGRPAKIAASLVDFPLRVSCVMRVMYQRDSRQAKGEASPELCDGGRRGRGRLEVEVLCYIRVVYM